MKPTVKIDLMRKDLKRLLPSWAAAAEPEGLIRVNSIALVGFKYDLDGDLKILDENLLKTGLAYCSAAPFSLDENLHLKIINAEENYGGIDFFDEQEEYDVLMLGNIYWPEGYLHQNAILFPDCFMSFKCQNSADWVDKATSLGIKAIFSTALCESLSVKDMSASGVYKIIDHDNISSGVSCYEREMHGFAVHQSIAHHFA